MQQHCTLLPQNKQGSDFKITQTKHPCLRKMFILLAITGKKQNKKHDIKETESYSPIKFIASLFEYSIILRHSGIY